MSLFGYGESFYYKSDDGLICQYVSGSNPMSIDCGHKSWLSNETKDLAVNLIEAYKMKLNTLPATLYVKADDIKDGKSGYQSLSVATGNAAGLFYRKNEKSDWVFFRTTQQALVCSQYNTQDWRA